MECVSASPVLVRARMHELLTCTRASARARAHTSQSTRPWRSPTPARPWRVPRLSAPRAHARGSAAPPPPPPRAAPRARSTARRARQRRRPSAECARGLRCGQSAPPIPRARLCAHLAAAWRLREARAVVLGRSRTEQTQPETQTSAPPLQLQLLGPRRSYWSIAVAVPCPPAGRPAPCFSTS